MHSLYIAILRHPDSSNLRLGLRSFIDSHISNIDLTSSRRPESDDGPLDAANAGVHAGYRDLLYYIPLIHILAVSYAEENIKWLSVPGSAVFKMLIAAWTLPSRLEQWTQEENMRLYLLDESKLLIECMLQVFDS